MRCSHTKFESVVSVARTENSRFLASIKIKCANCGEPFRFFGLSPGMDLNGARASADGVEAKLAIGTDESLAEYYRMTTGVSVQFEKNQNCLGSVVRGEIEPFLRMNPPVEIKK